MSVSRECGRNHAKVVGKLWEGVMGDSKHTPGPWKVFGNKVVWGGKLIARLCNDFSQKVGSVEANAHLVAAAPELLEACKTIVKYDTAYAEDELELNEAIKMISQAIAKAEGREE